jgi:hypothetical protein
MADDGRSLVASADCWVIYVLLQFIAIAATQPAGAAEV